MTLLNNDVFQQISVSLTASFKQTGLLGGDLGSILYLAHYNNSAKFINNSYFKELENLIDSLIECDGEIDELGTSWLIQHLINLGILSKDSIEVIEDVAQVIPKLIEVNYRLKEYELLYGIAGKTLFYFETYPKFDAKLNLEKIAHSVKEMAHQTTDGITWLAPKERIVNLGISHGTPAVIATLSKIFMLTGEGKETIEKSVSYLLAQKKKDSILDDYPQVVGENIEESVCRLAWCYGDLGIALALFHASKALDRDDWKQEAINTALKSTKRTPENSTIVYSKELGIFDAGFCHGTAGVAHIFNRFYKATKIQDFKVAADFWLQKTLESRLPDGKWLFPHYNYETSKRDWLESNSLLEGLAGVGLVLLGFYDENTYSAWDSIFLTDI
jgi:lantibiotic biosynthesis protein